MNEAIAVHRARDHKFIVRERTALTVTQSHSHTVALKRSLTLNTAIYDCGNTNIRVTLESYWNNPVFSMYNQNMQIRKELSDDQ